MTEARGYELAGQVAYIPANPISGMPNTPFYRLIKSGDHMDSTSINEGGYTLEQTLGYPLTRASAAPGLSPITRWRNTSNGDHATLNYVDSLLGYAQEAALGGFGWTRYGNKGEQLLRCPSSGTAGGVFIESNAVAGGALWQWNWNGTNFINHADLGRQIQTSIAQGLNADGTIDPQMLTEAGDKYPFYPNPSYAHGAPCLELRNMTAPSIGQISRAVPLEWHALNGGQQQPSLDIDTVLGKDIHLNYRMPDGVDRNWPVAKYVAYVAVPQRVSVRAAEIPTVYLPGSFNRFYTYDAGLPDRPGKLTEVTDQMPDGIVNFGWAKYFEPASKYGGVIVSDSTGTKAMGVYAAITTAPYPGCATMFGLWKFINPNGPHSTTSASCVKMSVWRGIRANNQGTAIIDAGVNRYSSWIMTDTVPNITKYMDLLRSQAAQGVHAPDAFLAWASENFSLTERDEPSISGPAAAPFGDGIPNLLRAAFGLGRAENATAWPKAELDGPRLSLRYRQLTGGQGVPGVDYTVGNIRYVVEVSDRLDGGVWTSGPDFVEPVNVSAVEGENTEIVTVRLKYPLNE